MAARQKDGGASTSNVTQSAAAPAASSSSSSSSSPSKSKLGDGAGWSSTSIEAAQLLGCTAGLYACYLQYGIVQERIYKSSYGANREKFNFSLVLVLAQSAVNAVAALALEFVWPRDMKSQDTKEMQATKVPHSAYVRIAICYLLAMFSSNRALRFVNYPTQVLGKSCKLIPVMLVGVFLNKRRYTAKQYAQVTAITLGIALFMGASDKSKHGGEMRIEGVLLLLLSLALDGFTGPLQERVIELYRPSPPSLMFGTNAYAFALCIVFTMLDGSLYASFQFAIRFPQILGDVAQFCVLSALGQYFIFATLFRFGSLVLVTITTTRKFFTILFSVIIFGNPVNLIQWTGVLLVFTGLGANIWDKFHARGNRNKKHVE